MTSMIPVLDLRLSEFAPDREQATQRWAAHELGEQRVRAREESRRMNRLYGEMALHAAERRTQLRLEAIKRGEVYIPPSPPVDVARSASYNASGWPGGYRWG